MPPDGLDAGASSAASVPRPATSAKLVEGLPVLVALAVMIVWSAHDGGYDEDTWYWGALVVLSLLVALTGTLGAATRRLEGTVKIALMAFAGYVAWSYLSITWAQSPGDALTGSNRALLYLLIFALFALSPWTPGRALGALVVYALGVGVIAVVLMATMASGAFSDGRLVSPTGYFNSSAALFTSAAFVAVGLAVRRELPALLRGVLIALACAGIQASVLAGSRGWLFTLPAVLITGIAVSRDRVRTGLAAILPVAAALLPLPRLLDVFRATEGAHPVPSRFVSASEHAGRLSLAICAGALIAGTLLAVADSRLAGPVLSRGRRRLLGAAAATLGLGLGGVGAIAATHGHPIRFIERQWQGFTNPSAATTTSSSSHFAAVGSGRFDFWRVSVDAVLAHPIGGLGQDNFADYYARRRRTGSDVKWTHSLEFRLLAHTGFVGFALFAVFLGAAVAAALRSRRRTGPLLAAVSGCALLPLIVWGIHGSLDWFWEMPCLTGPALGFLAMAGALAPRPPAEPSRPPRRPAFRRVATGSVGLTVLVAAVVVLGFSYLSVREVSTAADLSAGSPAAALNDLTTAAALNPLSADPGRLGGTIALQAGRFIEAEQRFRQAIAREAGGWFAWLGDGLAASALGDTTRATADFKAAARINSIQPAIKSALAHVNTHHPLTAREAFGLLTFVH
jgi:hypothetical protein